MVIKSVSSTQAQNNFGRVLEDITHNRTRYVVKRHGVPQVIILSLDDFAYTLDDAAERGALSSMLADLRPTYELGQIIDPQRSSEDAEG